MEVVRVIIEEIELEANKCYSEFETKFEILHNDNQSSHRSLQDCINTLLEIDNKLKDKYFDSNDSSSKLFFPSKDLKAVSEPIATKLAQEFQTIIQDSIDSFKKTIIDEKIIEVKGSRKRTNTFTKVLDNLFINLSILTIFIIFTDFLL